MYTSAEQVEAPICRVCGRKLAVGFHYTCHICGDSFCYAHAPAKCAHERGKVKRTPQARITR